MSYEFSPTADPLAIGPRQYATGIELRFVGVNAGLAVMTRNGTALTGVHLSMLAPGDDLVWCPDSAIEAALHLFGSFQEAVIAGAYGQWTEIPSLRTAYDRLMRGLADGMPASPSGPILVEHDSELAGGRIHHGKLQIFRGQYLDAP